MEVTITPRTPAKLRQPSNPEPREGRQKTTDPPIAGQGLGQTRPSPFSSPSASSVSKMAFMPQIVFAEEATRFLREPTTSGEVLKMGFRFWPSALTTPTPMPARRKGAAALNAIARLGGNNGNKTRR